MSDAAIFACREPVRPHWELGPLMGADLMLVGWSQPVRSADCGVPADVATVMARALTAIFRVAFPLSGNRYDALPPSRGDSEYRVFPLPARGLIMRLKATHRGLPLRRCLVSTRSPRIVMQLFDDPGFPWHLKGQVAFLSAPSAEPPAIAMDALLGLADDDWAEQAEALRGSCVEGILRPGVDGDVVGVLSLTADFQDRLCEALEREARGAGLGWSLLSEVEFMRALAGQ